MKKTLRPAIEGSIVRKPESMLPLAPEGEEVELSSFWHRRLRDGDVVEVEPKQQEVVAVELKKNKQFEKGT